MILCMSYPTINKDCYYYYSPECFTTFPGIFGDIPRNVLRHSPKCLGTFPGMFEDIPRNVWRHSPEYNIPPIPRVPRILFPVPVFLFLYITNIMFTENYSMWPYNSYMTVICNKTNTRKINFEFFTLSIFQRS